MKKICTITLFVSLFLGVSSYAQQELPSKSQDSSQKQKQNAWYVEFAGSGLIGVTFNYERYLSKKPGGLSLKVGFGGGSTLGFTESGLFGALPIGVNYSIPISGDKKNFIETGICYTVLMGAGESGYYQAIVGWKYVSKSNTLIRVTVLPLLYLPDSKGFDSPWFGFSIGKKF